jgi:hypothetical protein
MAYNGRRSNPMKFSLRGVALAAVLLFGACVTGLHFPASANVPIPTATGVFTSASSTPFEASMAGQSSCTFSFTGTTGAVDVYGSNDNSHWTPLNIRTSLYVLESQPFVPTAGVSYLIDPVAYAWVEVAPDSTYGSSTSSGLLRCSSAISRVEFQGPPGSPGAAGSPWPSPTVSNGPTAGPGQCSVTSYVFDCLFPNQTSSNVSSPCDTLSNTYGAYTLTGGGSCGGSTAAAFPWALRQHANICGGYVTSTCTFGTTPTSGDFLLALVAWDCAGTITTPSGWSIVATASCSGANSGAIMYDKTSAGTESTVAFVESSGSGVAGSILDFSGSRTVDKTATVASGSNFQLMPSLSSPTSGAGVIVLCSGLNASVGYPLVWSLTGTLNDWAQSSFSTGEYIVSAFAFWQNTVGTGTLYYPYCVEEGTGGLAAISLSLK